MKIAVLHSSFDGSTVPFKDLDPECDPARYLPGHSCTHFHITKATAVRQVTDIARQGFAVVINLCDGAWDEDRAGLEVVQALERLNVAFTGAGAAFYDPPREAMKMACHSVGVLFPAYVVAHDESDAERALAELRFPMIVKHPNSYSSIGLTRDSRVTEADGLRREVARMIESYGAALIEEFIEGREFTVLVTEPRDESEDAWALQPVEFCFPAGESFKHFDLKWKEFDSMETRLVDDKELASRLRETAALTFAALSGTGYGRCDLRVDAAGDIYLLEINPNCGIFYPKGQFGSADFILANDPAGHRGFLKHLLQCAKQRQERAIKPWELRYRRGPGFGMFAVRKLRKGEIVECYEERLHVLASRRHVERRWQGVKRQWFEQYAWPVTSNLHILWSDNPADWRPINHSCAPNTWLDGLDLVARREIAAGEELTVDYATFCGSAMSAFECQCGAADCRQVILGSDHLLPVIRERYRDHVSDYVQMAWHNTAPDWRPPYEIVQNSFGLGLVARRAWRAGDVVSPLSWEQRQPFPSRWTLQCGAEEHAAPLPFELRYVNHSCAPNVQFDIEGEALRALQDIEPGDELRFFYPATEWEMAEHFECECGAVKCLGRIAGAAQMPEKLLKQHALSGVIREKLAARRARKSKAKPATLARRTALPVAVAAYRKKRS